MARMQPSISGFRFAYISASIQSKPFPIARSQTSMETSPDVTTAAEKIRESVIASTAGAKRMKLRTLLDRFGYVKRSDWNTAAITTALHDEGISLNPPIVRFGENWEISLEDWIYLSDASKAAKTARPEVSGPEEGWKNDPWFEKMAGYELRTEKEVEIKFIVPLLARLGYGDDDRFDGMPVPAAHGSKGTTLVIDFALFDSSVEGLRHQPLLTVEAKKESRLKKREEILNAHNQAKSYCLWTQCEYFMITDSKTIQAFHIARGNLADLKPLFVCERHELKDRFADLFSIISREVLSAYYLAKLTTTEETGG